MVWIFFISTNRNKFQRNLLPVTTLGPEPLRFDFYLSQIESSGTFLTSHISTMLYHIVSGSSKLGQFRWSGFFFLYTNRNCFQMNQQPASTTGPEPLRYSSYLFQIDSSESFLTSHISTMLVSTSSKKGQFRWSGFFSYQKTGTIFTGLNYGRLLPDRNRLDSLSVSSKSNLLEHFSRATFP